MQIPEKIAIMVGSQMQCGLGDLFLWYYGHYGNSRFTTLSTRLKGFAQKNPDIKIKILLSCHHPQGELLFKYVPYFHSIESLTWTGVPLIRCTKQLLTDDSWTLASPDILEEIIKYDPVPTTAHLSPGEEVFVKNIVDKGSYVAIHPFSAAKDRFIMPASEYFPLVSEIKNTLGYNVVILGATFFRQAIFRNSKFQKPRQIIEEFNCPHKVDGVFNLVNKTNARVGAWLTEHSIGFMGARSCFACIARETHRPSVLFCGLGGAAESRAIQRQGKWDKNCLPIAIPRKDKDFKSYRQQAIRFFLELKP